MNNSTLLKMSSILWVIWGVVHVIAGLIILNGDATTAVQAIADAVEPDILAMNYPDAVNAILNHHGSNLLWFGLVTIAGATYVWRENTTAIFVTAMVAGLADLGYFIFLDLGGYVNFVPGTAMTVVSSLSITLSFIAFFRKKSAVV